MDVGRPLPPVRFALKERSPYDFTVTWEAPKALDGVVSASLLCDAGGGRAGGGRRVLVFGRRGIRHDDARDPVRSNTVSRVTQAAQNLQRPLSVCLPPNFMHTRSSVCLSTVG